MYNFDPYSVLLVIATDIAVLLMTASVLQGHILISGVFHTFTNMQICTLKQQSITIFVWFNLV